METFDVAIIGSGPAGLTAGIYTSRANLKTLILAGVKWGGQLMLTTTVENYPGFPDGIQGPELMDKMKSQAEKFGSKIVSEDVIKVEKFPQSPLFSLSSQSFLFSARSAIIATGADTLWLNLPNEQRLIGHGVSSCAPCDAFFFKNKKVAVVGGGDAAMEEALVLTKFANEVTIVHRRDSFRASKIMQDRVLNSPKIKILWNTEVADVLGAEKVEKLQLTTLNSAPPQAEQVTSRPEGGISYQFPVDGLFVAIGHSPNSQVLQDLVATDQKGYVLKLRNLTIEQLNNVEKEVGAETLARMKQYPTSTSVPGVFVAGDVHDYHYKQAVTAAGYGCQAALNVEKWLENQVKNFE